MSFYDDDEDFDQKYDDVDEEFDEDGDEDDEDGDEDDETLKELDVDENGHVIEGRRKPRSRDDEYEEEEYE
jgi:hypothetical protein